MSYRSGARATQVRANKESGATYYKRREEVLDNLKLKQKLSLELLLGGFVGRSGRHSGRRSCWPSPSVAHDQQHHSRTEEHERHKYIGRSRISEELVNDLGVHGIDAATLRRGALWRNKGTTV